MLNRLKTFIAAAVLGLSLASAAIAQTSPNWPFGYVPTIQEWNTTLANKMDYNGSPAIVAAGGTFTGKVNFAASTTGSAGMNCGVGVTPTVPVNGDIWCTSSGMFVQINGSTVGPLGSGAGGTLAVGSGGTGQTSFTANLPILGNGAGALAQGTRSGSTTVFATATGTLTSGHCVSLDGSGNFVDAGGACTTGGGGGTVASSTIGQVAVYTGATTVTGIAACNNGYYGTNGAGVASCITSFNTTLSATIAQLGTVTVGTWNAGVIAGQYGGTGVANTGFTITLAGNLTTAGANSLTLTTIGATNVTLPTTGTLLNQNGTSGGIPYYNTTTSVQSSAALTANLPVFGGGAGSAPFSGTRLGNTTKAQMANASTTPVTNNCVSYDANGNTQDSGQPCGGANAAPVLLLTLTASTSSSLTDVGACSTGGTTGCFTATYASYLITFLNIVATTPSTNLGCQIAVHVSGSYQTSGYIGVGATTYIPCLVAGAGLGSNSLAAPGVSGSVIVYNPSASAKAQWIGTFSAVTGSVGSPVATTQQVGSWWNTNGVVDGFRACVGTAGGTCAGTIASGVIKIYGLP